MASKKKTPAPKVKKQVKVKQSDSSRSLMMLGIATALLVTSYIIFTSVSKRMPANTNGDFKPNNMSASDYQVQVVTENGSGEYGVATFKDMDGKTLVHLEIVNSPQYVSQPAHIHVGTCVKPGAIKYPLADVVDGVSDTTLNVSVHQIMSEGPLLVNVHKSAKEMGKYVACGELSS